MAAARERVVDRYQVFRTTGSPYAFIAFGGVVMNMLWRGEISRVVLSTSRWRCRNGAIDSQNIILEHVGWKSDFSLQWSDQQSPSTMRSLSSLDLSVMWHIQRTVSARAACLVAILLRLTWICMDLDYVHKLDTRSDERALQVETEVASS